MKKELITLWYSHRKKLSTEAGVGWEVGVGWETGSSRPFFWTQQHPNLIFSSLNVKIFPVPDADSKEDCLPVPVSELFPTAPFYLIHKTRLCAGTMTSLHCTGKELQHGGVTASWLPVSLLRSGP